MTVRYCTLFDRNYATRGLVMLESLERFRRAEDEVIVLTLDDVARSLVERVGSGRWRAISVADMQDGELADLQMTRPHREFCWTCTPALSAWVMRQCRDGDIAVYLDGDLMFFDDPGILLLELGETGSVLIHEHRFSPDRQLHEASSGRFNVGFVAFKAGGEARDCVMRWRAQTIARCELDPENGYCGDQGYLNDWPARYPNVRIMSNIGGGVAPWNVEQYVVSSDQSVVTVDRVPVVFFHYHAFKLVLNLALGVAVAEPAQGYEFTPVAIDAFFRPYGRALRRAMRRASREGFRSSAESKLGWRESLFGLRRAQYILTI